MIRQAKTLRERFETSPLYAANAPFIEGLYEDFLRDADSVPVTWRAYFEGLRAGTAAPKPERPRSEVRESFARAGHQAPPPAAERPLDAPVSSAAADKQVGVLKLIQAYRRFGHLAAELDPLAFRPKPDTRVLQLETHGLSEADLDLVFHSGTLAAPRASTLRHILEVLQDTYTGHLGIEYTHINNIDQRLWIQERMEQTRARATLEPPLRRQILQRVIAAEGLERYLHTRYAGQKRFSLEGGECLVPMLDELIESSGRRGVKEIAIGMAHRGRLNILINIMGKDPAELFMMFEGRYHGADQLSGDVKYHEGFSSNVHTGGGPVHLALAFNPSHLEIICPVVEGSVRSRQDRRLDGQREQVVPILIHGDAAIAGQGVVYETINQAQTRGFTTGGTLHIVVNNQIGFTTSHPLDTRSTRYCTEIGKVVQAPIFHVNGDDPDAVVFAAQVALEFRMTFKSDVFLDLICYRRHGHNEADEPAVTQPRMYEKIRAHPTLPEIYGKRLVDEGVVDEAEPERLAAAYREDLEAGRRVSLNYDPDFVYPYTSNWTPYLKGRWDDPADTTVPLETIRRLGERLHTLPEDLQLHPRVERIIEDRRKMVAGGLPIDWGCAETLAYASLLDQDYAVRLTGQDSGRGTFFHRHAVLHNQRTGDSYIPLQRIKEDQPLFTVVDSILSEEAVLAFEYGYATTEPDTLVIWEAQFGDFANVAQVVIDQFIASSEQKWRRLCGIVLMLPHGWEGQGPEHSSARLERFMLLCAQENIQVCNPSTPAQMFHLLRRELVRPYRKPLVLMTPKSTLRRKLSFSSLEDLTERGLQLVIGEIDDIDPNGVQRVALCSGKVFYDLLEERRKRGQTNVALVRIEQLYPFPSDALRDLLGRYPGVRDLVWVQEEPRNQGAWFPIQHNLRNCLRHDQVLTYVGRPASASPAVGDAQKHTEQQRRLVNHTLSLESSPAVAMLTPEPGSAPQPAR